MQGVAVIRDEDQHSTDLMKCISSLFDLESRTDGVSLINLRTQSHHGIKPQVQHDIIILGGLSGRLDQTIHTLSYLHKLRKTRESVFAITEDNVAWVLDSVRSSHPFNVQGWLWLTWCDLRKGEHEIHVNHKTLGKTCGLLPLGISSTTLTTRGLQWNLSTLIRPNTFAVLTLLLQPITHLTSMGWFQRPTTSYQKNRSYMLRRRSQSGGRSSCDQKRLQKFPLFQVLVVRSDTYSR
jgi:thiamine pyrophosphokinase